ncbi:hypothetical protein KY289_022201 [Solanum tuberosum]|nr:hypothetical protein KY289_022201 [Solanum tuberosum]
MAREPPAELPRSPDDVQMERLNVNYKTHPATLSDSSYNSTNLQNTVAINTAISVKELEGTRKIIPPEASALIHGNARITRQFSRETRMNRQNRDLNFELLPAKLGQIQPLGITPLMRRFISQKSQVEWTEESPAGVTPTKIVLSSPEFMKNLDMTRSGKPTEESGHDEQQRKEQENQRQQFKGKEVQVGLSKQANDQLQDSNKQGEANRFQ